MSLNPGQRAALERQRFLSHLVGGLLLWPLIVVWMRYLKRYRVDDLVGVRRHARQLLNATDGPVLVCSNHLTWIDSLVLQWVVASPLDVLRSPRLVAWNLPEQRNFYTKRWLRVGCYLAKCIPIVRGGNRTEQKLAMDKVCVALEQRELVLVFPEGGRSRSGRVELEDLAYGVGRLVRSVQGCKVLCVYLRGAGQRESTVLPRRGERFTVDMELIVPGSASKGLRGTRETAMQIGRKLVELENCYFARR